MKTPPLPKAYETSYLVCLVKNVHWVHVFWELTTEFLQSASSQLAINDDSTRKLLRVWKGQKGSQTIVCDISIDLDIGAQYVHLPEPGDYYQMEILLVNNSDSVSLLTSNFFATPFGRVAEEIDSKWASIDELYHQYESFKSKSGQSSPHLWQITSPTSRPEAPKDELELVIDMDLLIYGKTKPNANIYVQGEAIKTNHDGSFTLRYNLAEGCSIFPIKAVSQDGSEIKTIVPLITRETY